MTYAIAFVCYGYSFELDFVTAESELEAVRQMIPIWFPDSHVHIMADIEGLTDVDAVREYLEPTDASFIIRAIPPESARENSPSA